MVHSNACALLSKMAKYLTHFCASVSFLYLPASSSMFKVTNRNSRTRCAICSKLTTKVSLLLTLYIFIVCTPLSAVAGEERGGWASSQIFIKGGLDRTSTFRGGLLGKRGVTFFRGGCNFQIKSKLKSEIYNNKKVYKQKSFSLS